MSELKCPNCSANIIYYPNDKYVTCPYCMSKFSPSDINPEEQEILKKKGKLSKQGKDFNQYRCKSCGAALIISKDTSAFPCPYCGGTMITEDLSGEFKPESIIPFKLTKEQFKEGFKEYTKRLLVPNPFKRIKELDKNEGIYLPYNLYDSEAKGYFFFKCEEDSSETVTDSNGQTHTETSTTTTYEYAQSHIIVKNLSLPTTDKINYSYLNSIQPYDFSQLEKFNYSYLAGFTAEKINMDEDLLQQNATEEIRQALVNEANPSHYSCVDRAYVLEEDYEFDYLTKTYALLPAYVTHVNYKEKNYLYVCNGQTGKITGSLPLSVPKSILLFLSVFLGIDIIPMILSICYKNPFLMIIFTVIAIFAAGIVLLVNILSMQHFKYHDIKFRLAYQAHNEIPPSETRRRLKQKMK